MQQNSIDLKMSWNQWFFSGSESLWSCSVWDFSHSKQLTVNLLGFSLLLLLYLDPASELIYLFIFTFLPPLPCFSHYSYRSWGSAHTSTSVSLRVSRRLSQPGCCGCLVLGTLCGWADLSTVGWSAPSLASTPWMLAPSPPVVTTSNASRHCQTSPAEGAPTWEPAQGHSA